MARQIFKAEDPIGQQVLIQRIVTGKRALGAPIPWEIVGVVAGEKVNGLEGDLESNAPIHRAANGALRRRQPGSMFPSRRGYFPECV